MANYKVQVILRGTQATPVFIDLLEINALSNVGMLNDKLLSILTVDGLYLANIGELVAVHVNRNENAVSETKRTQTSAVGSGPNPESVPAVN